MEAGNSIHPDHAAMLDTDDLREQFLIEDLCTGDVPKLNL